MRFFTTAVALLSLVASTLSKLTVDKYPGAPSDRYLVKVKDGVNKDNLIAQVEQAHGQVTNKWTVVNGFAGVLPLSLVVPSSTRLTRSLWIGNFDTTVLNIILDSPDVEAVSEDGTASISTIQYVVQDVLFSEGLLFGRPNAPWGLSRISHRPPLPKGSDPK
jgi:hypothetical protein